ncbi:MAG: efflux transporter outer membrane subunit [Hyphomonadaceae bacterium]
MKPWHGVSVSLTALLAGCITAGPDFNPPAKPEAQSYAMPGDAPTSASVVLTPSADAPAEWWRAFGSEQINALVADAMVHNHTLAEADATLDRARANLGVARGEALPQADAQATVERQRVNTQRFGISGFPSPTVTLYTVGPSVSFDLDLFGAHRRTIEREGARLAAETARVDAAYLTLTGNVVRQAILIAGLRAKIATQEEIVADGQRTLSMVRRAIEAGGEPEAAANTAEAQLAEDQAKTPPLRQQLAEARHRLALLMGRLPATWSAPDLDFADIAAPTQAPVALPSELVRRRPDIVAAEADLHAATANIGVARAALYPQLQLNASFVQTSVRPEDLFQSASAAWNVGPSLTAPLFHGGALRANARGAEAAARAAQAAYQQTVLTAFVQVADVMAAIGHDEEALAAQRHAVDAALANQRTAELAYENGAGALFPVIDAQRQARRARLDAIDAQMKLYSDMAALYVATAADWRAGGDSARRSAP